MNIIRISIYKLGLYSIFDLSLLGKAVLLCLTFITATAPLCFLQWVFWGH